MGTWGTGISSNDVYEDINYQFFELYKQGMTPFEITEQLIKDNKELIESQNDSTNFWITIAKSQWECKSLDPKVLFRVKDIVKSEKDIELWKVLNASQSDLTKRKKVLDSFLKKISTEKKASRKRKAKKLRNASFEKGDCLIFKLTDGDYCGVFVLEAEKETEFGLNLIVITDIKQTNPPTEKDFEKAKLIFRLEKEFNKEYKPKEQISWHYAQHFKKAKTEFIRIGKLKVSKNYNSNNDYQSFSNWDNPKLFLDEFYSDFKNNKCNVNITLSSLRKKSWFR